MINWFEKHNKISLIITLAIALIIFYLSSKTFEGVYTGPSINSYIYHFLAFFFLAFFLLISLTKGKSTNLFLIIIFIAILYGIIDELHQFFVPGRYCCLIDVLTNSIGILSSGILYSFKIKK